MWERAFRKDHVVALNTIKNRLAAIMKDYMNKVYTNVRRTKKHENSSTLAVKSIPYHLLCISHTCEKFDECNVQTLAQIEAKIKLREQIEKREPQLKSFLHPKRCIVTDVVIPGLLKLVSRDGDGKTTSLAD